MALPQFFLDHQIIAEETASSFPLRLSDEDFRHARVLRLKPGEHIAVIDAMLDYFECEIVAFDHDTLMVQITNAFGKDIQRPAVVLVQGLAKGDKMDMIIRHATELGVAGFIPFVGSRSIVKLDQKKEKNRVHRWRSIAKSAAMQSGQPFIPEVSEISSLEGVCDFVKQAAAVAICWEEEKQRSIRVLLEGSLTKQCISPEDARIAVIVGPEGGLSETEVETLCKASPYAQTVSLGPSILRTETAGIVAPALVLHELENFA